MTVTKTGFTHESTSAETTSWYTPAYIFDLLGLTFDLDVCAPQGGVPWIPAKKYYALPQDGLELPWDGLVWCNPPYGKETPKWLAKMNTERNGIALVFARTDTKWFHDYLAKADCLLFLKGRIQFVDGLQKTGAGGSTCGSVLVGYGDVATTALTKMKDKGFLVLNTQYNKLT